MRKLKNVELVGKTRLIPGVGHVVMAAEMHEYVAEACDAAGLDWFEAGGLVTGELVTGGEDAGGLVTGGEDAGGLVTGELVTGAADAGGLVTGELVTGGEDAAVGADENANVETQSVASGQKGGKRK